MDVRTLVRACIHYLPTVGEENILHLFDPAVHKIKANNLLQLDHIKLGATKNAIKYVVMFCKDHLEYKRLFAFFDDLNENFATAIID